MAADDLVNHALAYLDAVVQALNATPAGAPSKQFISPGVPALDCDQVVVYSPGPIVAPTGVYSGALGADHRFAVAQVTYVRFTAMIVRCAPTQSNRGTPPSAAAQIEAAKVTMTDVWAVWNHINTLVRSSIIFSADQHCREFAFEPAVSLSIEGGLCGWLIPLHVQVDGYTT